MWMPSWSPGCCHHREAETTVYPHTEQLALAERIRGTHSPGRNEVTWHREQLRCSTGTLDVSG